MLEHGLIDAIVPRSEHKKYISDMVKFLTNNKTIHQKDNQDESGNNFELKLKTKG